MDDSDPVRGIATSNEVAAMSGAPIKILLVEDNPADARMAAELLGGDAGFELTHVERLSEAATRLSQGGFDAVLLDLMLPDSSGLATVNSVQDRAPDLPIVVFSGFGAEDLMFAREAVRGGAQEFLPKSLATRSVMQRAILTSIERKRLERRRIRFARHDELTGLANRLLLEERFERAAARAERESRYLALVTIELDHFLSVVERMGSAFGDRLLCAVAERLARSIRRSDTLARVRERGFAALLEGLPTAEVVNALTAKLRDLMAPPFRLDDHDVFLSASVGIALYPIHGGSFDALMDAAERAMFAAAMAGGGTVRVAQPDPAARSSGSGQAALVPCEGTG
jgi:diguanylate cyclase (GGDEF)-like protein